MEGNFDTALSEALQRLSAKKEEPDILPQEEPATPFSQEWLAGKLAEHVAVAALTTPQQQVIDPNDDICGTDEDLAADLRQFTTPKPISDKYECLGAADVLGELKDVYAQISASMSHNRTYMVRLDGGEAVTEKTSTGNWQVIDESKGLEYLQENVSVHYDGVEEEDTFIWVIRKQDRADLGYIHRGYCFIAKDA